MGGQQVVEGSSGQEILQPSTEQRVLG
uniref:Uncharacterized protein n=1 Tax=Arundo donax TaxID=35708 RepID=A0A0A8YBM9_ARUDO